VATLRALVVEHHAALYRYAYRLTGQQADAEDLTQQAFLVAQQKLHQLREPGRARAWLFAVLRSCFLKNCRKWSPEPGGLWEAEEVAAESPALDAIDQQGLAEALAELPDEFRVVVLMFYFEDLSYKEIAEQLELPIGTVMSRLSRAKGHLRRRLADDWTESPDAATSAASPSKLSRRDVVAPSPNGTHPNNASRASSNPT
jgi:RNA polymerase sigma-70 factor (ECF subfamily)